MASKALTHIAAVHFTGGASWREVVIIGASIGGLPAACEARELLAKKHKVTVISNVESFHFVPSNPWVAVGWRTEDR